MIVGGGERWSWGNSSCGQLGDGSTTRSYSPVKVKLQGKKEHMWVRELTEEQSHPQSEGAYPEEEEKEEEEKVPERQQLLEQDKEEDEEARKATWS